MLPFFVLWVACYIIWKVAARLLETRYAGTSFGAAVSYIN